MGTVVILSVVGNRDLACDGRYLDQERFRQLCDEILQDYSSYRERLSAPILEPVLAYIARRHGESHRRLLLFGTHQGEKAPPEYRIKDTDLAARLLSRYLGEAKGKPVHEVKVREVVSKNPAAYDEMLEYFQGVFGRRSDLSLFPEDLEASYICPMGGTPAANTAMLLAAISAYGELNYPNLRALVHYVATGGAGVDGQPLASQQEQEALGRVLDLLHRLDPLAALRNRMTHGLEGVSEEQVRQSFGGPPEAVVELMEEILKTLPGGGPQGLTPLHEVVQWIQDRLR